MIALHPEYIIDNQEQKKSVVLPFNEWENIMSEIEELDDIRSFDAAKADAGITIPFEQAIKEIKNNAIL